MANKYWIGGGTNTNWNSSPVTNWSATSGGTTRTTAPGTADAVIFDGVGVTANDLSTLSASLTVTSFTVLPGFTGTINHVLHLTVSTNVTLHPNYITTGTGALILTGAGAGILTSNGKAWSGGLSNNGTVSKTLADDWIFLGNMIFASGTTTLNGFNIYFKGNLTVNGTVAGSTTLIFNGTASVWTQGAFNLSNPIIIAGDLTASGIVRSNGSLVYQSGNVVTTGSTLILGASQTIDTSSVVWYNVNFNSGTKTLLSDLIVNNTLNVTIASNSNGYKVFVNVSILVNGNIAGTTEYVLRGRWSSTGSMNSHLIFDGDCTVAGSVRIGTGGVLSKISGTVITAGSTLTVSGNVTLDTDIVWENVQFTAACNITLLQTLFSALITHTTASSTCVYLGIAGFDVGTYTASYSTAAGTITLKVGLVYKINTFLQCWIGNEIFTATFISSDPVKRANLILAQNATCRNTANFTRIDARGGRIINTWNGVVIDCLNINPYTDYESVAITF